MVLVLVLGDLRGGRIVRDCRRPLQDYDVAAVIAVEVERRGGRACEVSESRCVVQAVDEDGLSIPPEPDRRGLRGAVGADRGEPRPRPRFRVDGEPAGQRSCPGL